MQTQCEREAKTNFVNEIKAYGVEVVESKERYIEESS